MVNIIGSLRIRGIIRSDSSVMSSCTDEASSPKSVDISPLVFILVLVCCTVTCYLI
ncbi:hypothetical protein DPMN_140605 [Dreissena polymorpha]|uniref:Uncharacterized protein n=1 Tax=Dreissena polymorpha TaxID=45954 RepID=A0A9D4JGU4_DREPO|nr:hypothetical protein DPMN_140605 [Dreissena polymorpha]